MMNLLEAFRPTILDTFLSKKCLSQCTKCRRKMTINYTHTHTLVRIVRSFAWKRMDDLLCGRESMKREKPSK